MIPPEPPSAEDATRLAELRAALPALGAGIYLNTGTSGPLPAETAAAMRQVADYLLTVGRGNVDGFAEFQQRLDEARAATAAVLTVDVDDIALTHATTDGMNLAVNGIDWQPGDRALTTRHEHPGGVGPLYVQRQRRGIDVAFLDIGDGGDHGRILDAFEAAIDERTRAVVISHVLWTTGAVMPVREIADLAHAHGAVVIVDGAQSAGAIAVDVHGLGADAYAIPGQKWLLGPEGTGALAVTAAGRERIGPSQAGWFAFERIDSAGDAAFWSTARRYEGTSYDRASITGYARSIGWLSMYVGLPWMHERAATMTRRAWDRLTAIEGVEVLTPELRRATLVSFRIRGWSSQAVMDELGARIFAIVRVVPQVDAVRLSIGWFTSEEEIDRVVDTITMLAAHTPETVPPRRTLTLLEDR